MCEPRSYFKSIFSPQPLIVKNLSQWRRNTSTTIMPRIVAFGKKLSVYLHDTRDSQQKDVKKDTQSWVLHSVISRGVVPMAATQRQIVLNYDVIAHVNKQFPQTRGIEKKLLLAILWCWSSIVDLVAADFNGAAWRRPCGNDRNSPVLLKKPSPDTDLPMPPGPHHCRDQVRYQANGLVYPGSSSHHDKVGSTITRYVFHSPFVPWVFVKRITAATMRYGSILHLPTTVVKTCPWQTLTRAFCAMILILHPHASIDLRRRCCVYVTLQNYVEASWTGRKTVLRPLNLHAEAKSIQPKTYELPDETTLCLRQTLPCVEVLF